MNFYGSKWDDVIELTGDYDRILAGRGDDYIILDTDHDVRINGGRGADTFEFHFEKGQTFDIDEVNGSKTVVTIYDGDHEQTITLVNVEHFTWYMVA